MYTLVLSVVNTSKGEEGGVGHTDMLLETIIEFGLISLRKRWVNLFTT